MRKRSIAGLLSLVIVLFLLPAAAFAAADETGVAGVLWEIFHGQVSESRFVPAKVVRLKMEYRYSNTGGLAGIDAAAPEVVEAQARREEDGSYKLEVSLPEVEGFRIVLNPEPLNEYVVNPPTGEETPEQLQQMLQSGAFDVDINDPAKPVYYYQEAPGQATNPTYGNRYSTQYNLAWNAARTITTADYMATASSEKDAPAQEGHGANPLENPKLNVTLTEEQLERALAASDGLHITVNYRRNATWYTVNHWVPEELSNLTPEQLQEKKNQGQILTREENGAEVTYVLLDMERGQGRVGALTRATAKTGGVYDLMVPLSFSQQLIVNEMETNSIYGTTVDIYYKAADAYRVIFDTDDTYIRRQLVYMGNPVDFTAVPVPQRKGYTFVGWQYLKKSAVPDEHGEYAAGDYTSITDSSGNHKLVIDKNLIFSQAKLTDVGGVQALYLYPIWEPGKTQLTVILWTEDLDGLTDVQATAEGGTPTYYQEKYAAYQDPVHSKTPALGGVGSNSGFSNVGSFTMEVDTDSVLEGTPAAEGGKTLRPDVQQAVEDHFMASSKALEGVDLSQFYTQCAFELLHESDRGIEYGATTASADGRTMLYVYFTRNIYTLTFHYYGSVGNETKVATGTNGYSYGGAEKILDSSGRLNFGYTGSGKVENDPDNRTWNNSWQTVPSDQADRMPVPETITISAKYGADLRQVWPVARAEEYVPIGGKNFQAVSWATTAGKYRKDALDPASSHYYEATLMGLYAAMDSEIIADPAKPEQPHHLVIYWSGVYPINYYRYNHCYELPGLELGPSVKAVTLYGQGTPAATELRNQLFLVPDDDPAITKFGFTDLLQVSYEEATKTVTYSADGQEQMGGYYAVRGYTVDGDTKYYAVARQIETVSTNAINKQNPSARTHMTRVNETADYTTQKQPLDGQTWSGYQQVGSAQDPYDLYFYYDRDRYSITYMAPQTGTDDQRNEVELGSIELPYGAHVTKEKYGFQLHYQDTNQAVKEDGQTPKYLWSYPRDDTTGDILDAVPVCPDRNPAGRTEWRFKGWALGPAGVNMLWAEPDRSGAGEPQAQVGDDFYIGSKLLLYAIWETPSLTVTFHLNGGTVSGRDSSVTVQVPANRKLTDSEASIPRPFRSGYIMKGWYQSDAHGTVADPENEDSLFNFDQVIIEDQHVAAVWTATSTELYSYDVYYVTPSLREGEPETPTIQLDENGNLTDAGTTYYVLEHQTYPDQLYADNTVVNLTAKKFDGYTPRATNQTLALTESGNSYHIVFYYDPQIPKSYSVRFVEAGTEAEALPRVVLGPIQVQAERIVATPSAAAVQELTALGYELVKKAADGTYEAVTHPLELTWLDAQGQAQPMGALAGGALPPSVTYLVQPVVYPIVYQNAYGSPAGADSALAAVANPTRYTVGERFQLTNPGPVSTEDGRYVFSHWSLGEDTTSAGPNSAYPVLNVEAGSTGRLVFVANWKKAEVPAAEGRLTVTKTVAGAGADPSLEFSFTVVLDFPLSGQFGGMTFTDGVAAFPLRHGQSVTATGLPAGIGYTVRETAARGYTTTSTGASGVIEADKTAFAAFTNTKDSPYEPEPGGDDDDPKLNTDDHYSYIIGYEDGTLRPCGELTRGEAATIFFRLLTDRVRETYWSQTNDYSDCSPDLWCNNAISTLTNMGILGGFEDGTFRPQDEITRAQFTKLAVGFFESTEEPYAGQFSDVAAGAWYTNYVEAASRVGLVQGFGDGSFRPDDPITRAQACVVVNRALGRRPDKEHLLPARDMVTWPDNRPGDWYYADLQEATNSHDYRWLGQDGDEQYLEVWTKKLEQRNWAALEHAWSTAHSAPGGEVAK